MRFDVKGQTALVTVPNRGIGKAIVQSLLKHGAAKVYAAVRDPNTAAELVKASGGRVVPVRLDVSNPDTIAAAAKLTHDVQLVINNAGAFRGVSPLSAEAVEA